MSQISKCHLHLSFGVVCYNILMNFGIGWSVGWTPHFPEGHIMETANGAVNSSASMGFLIQPLKNTQAGHFLPELYHKIDFHSFT